MKFSPPRPLMEGQAMDNTPDYENNLYFERKNTMTQKVFDTDNADDMALLWSILPESITKLTPIDNFLYTPDNCIFTSDIIKIDFHDKREIIRPIPEATEADIGKICKFGDISDELCVVAVLQWVKKNNGYIDDHGTAWNHCRRLTKQEIEELC